MGTIDSMKSILTLDALCKKFHIHDVVHPELSGRNDRICNTHAEMDLFAFINHADLTKVRIRERVVAKGEGASNDDVNKEGNYAAKWIRLSRRVRKKRKAADGASGSGLPPKKLREYYGTSGIGTSTGGKFVAAIQSLLEGGTLAVEVGVTTSHPAKRFVISSDSAHDFNANAADDEVTSIVRSFVPPPPVLTVDVATTISDGVMSALVHESGTGQVQPSIFRDSASPSTAEANVASPSQPVGAEVSTYTFLFIKTWNLRRCIRMQLEHKIMGMKKFEGECVMQDGWLKEKDVEIASLKSLLSLKEAEVAKAIRFRGQVAIVEAVKLSCDELSIKAATLESKKDKLIDQVTALEATCSGLRDEVMGYKLFKEQVKEMQDEQVKVLSDEVAGLDANLMEIALHLDKEFYPRYLTTIGEQRWILGHSLKLAVMKCLQSPEYLAVLGGAICRAIDKGMQDGLAVGIDHGKVRRSLAKVIAYNPATEANYLFAMNPLRAMEFPLFSQLESHKDANMADIMGLLPLEGPAAEISRADQLQPSPEQLMIPIYRLEDQAVIEDTSLSFSLDVTHTRVQRLIGNATVRQLSISDALVPLVEPLSAETLVGTADTFRVPDMATTTALSTTFV
nr:hypothetical protein [Tanacetum cinerariifolium]